MEPEERPSMSVLVASHEVRVPLQEPPAPEELILTKVLSFHVSPSRNPDDEVGIMLTFRALALTTPGESMIRNVLRRSAKILSK